MSGFEFKGTPGPWESSKAICGRCDTETRAIYHYPEEYVCIEVVETGCNCGDEAIKKEEDAWLIAAAPELFEELKQADAQLEMAANAIERGLYDEAMLHCRSMVRHRKEALTKAITKGEDDE